MFDTLEMSLTVLEQLAPVEAKIRQRRTSLADEIGRAAESVARSVSEARQRAGLDRADLFRPAAGSASELTTALRIARARADITSADFAAIDATLDRVRAMLWRLTHGFHPGSAWPSGRDNPGSRSLRCIERACVLDTSGSVETDGTLGGAIRDASP